MQIWSLKKYSAEIYINALEAVQCPNCNIFSNANVVYLDLLILDTVDNVAPIKEIRIKNNTQDWFDNETVKAIKIRDNFFFKKSKIQSSNKV